MIKKVYVILLISILMISCAKKETKQNSNHYEIGILQLVAHPALDKARNGFKDVFKEKGIDVNFKEKNANGEIGTANLIASGFVNEKVDLIYSIATTSTQASANATSTIPIVFAAVTDPKSSGVLKQNITGVSDKVNIKEQLELLLKIKKDVKTLGFIYNSSEKNSVSQLEDIENIAKKFNIEIVPKSITQANEVPQAVKYLISKTDALYTPTDNLVASVMKIIADSAVKNKKIIIAAESSHVDAGALITKSIDYYELGRKAAEMAIDILVNKTKVEYMPYTTLKANEIKINEETLKKLNIILPDDIR